MKECPKDVEADGQMESKLIKVAGAQITSQDSAGYVTGVKVGEETLNGETFRDTYGLLSSCFELQEFEGKMRVTTKGIGHGLGMSQNTANEMANFAVFLRGNRNERGRGNFVECRISVSFSGKNIVRGDKYEK